MPSISKCFVFLALSLTTATALTHGHIAHQGVARSVVEDLTKKDTFVPAVQRRANNSKRCKSRPKHSGSSSSSSTPSHAKPTPKADHKADPPQSSSSSSSSSFSHPHHHHATQQQPDPTTSSDSPKHTPNDGNGNGGNGDGGNGGSGGGGQSYSGGSATFYTQNGNEGACGKANSDDAHICALFTSVYAGGKHCGQQIMVTNLNNGKTLPVTVADECPTCNGPNYVDFSQGAFEALGGTQEEGMFPIKYSFM